MFKQCMRIRCAQVYMAVCFWYLLKSDLSSVRVHVLLRTLDNKTTRLRLSGQVVYVRLVRSIKFLYGHNFPLFMIMHAA